MWTASRNGDKGIVLNFHWRLACRPVQLNHQELFGNKARKRQLEKSGVATGPLLEPVDRLDRGR